MKLPERIYASSPASVRTVLMNLQAARIWMHRYGAPYRAALAMFDSLARADQAIVRQFQVERLRRVLVTAAANSPFYKRLFADFGISPAEVTTLDSLRALPLLTRETLREHEHEILTRRRTPRDWLHGSTSGTTGSPLSLWYDRATCVMTNAADGLQKLWGGRRDEDWIGLFLGRTVTPLTETQPPFWQRNHVLKQQWFSSFHLSEANLPLYAAEIRRRKLRFLEGYPSTLYIVARYLIETDSRLQLQAVFSSSETMLDIQREAIEEAFGCRVFDFYGHAERAVFAIECEEHGAKHIVEPYGYVEIVDGEGRPVPDGEPGYVVGTSLHNTAMPLLRYRTTDISAVEVGPCQCGRTFRRLRRVSTKAEDIVVLPDGRWISPSILTHPFKPFPQIRKSQVIQERVDEILVKVVASEQFTLDHEGALLGALSSRLGPGIKVRLQRVHDIPPERSGKFRWVVSHIKHGRSLNWQD